MTKPVSRFRYLLGKWLGVVVLNAVIPTIAGISTFLYPVSPHHRCRSGHARRLDRLAVAKVPTARSSAFRCTAESRRICWMIWSQSIENDPLNDRYGRDLPDPVRRGIERRIRRGSFTRRTVPPGQNGEPGARTFVFAGLQDAYGSSPLTLPID